MEDYQLITTNKLIEESFVEDTHILGTLLSIKSGTTAARTFQKKFPFPNTNKKMRYESETRYHRLMIFRETMSTTGQCFAILMGTSAEFDDFSYNGLTIGHVISIVEPEFKSNYLSESYDLPIVASRVPTECDRVDTAHIASNIIIPPRAGCTTSFRRAGVTLNFKGAVFDDTDCAGTMCDRQKKLCSCVYSDYKKFTYVVKVQVKMDDCDEYIDC